ncbi:MAG: DUF2065 domain-containing protein [Mangrovicoccus sp.]
MMTLLMAAGFVLVFEGLVFALAPSRLEDLIDMLSRLSIDNRRLIGLSAVAIGVALLWISTRG